MANTVNGGTSISADTDRIRTGVELTNALRAISPGELLEARVVLDTTGAFTIDDPTVDHPDGYSGQRIFVQGIRHVSGTANNVTLYSKVGSASAVIIAGPFELGADSGILIPASSAHNICRTERNGALQIAATGVSGADTVEIHIDYIIASSLVLPGG